MRTLGSSSVGVSRSRGVEIVDEYRKVSGQVADLEHALMNKNLSKDEGDEVESDIHVGKKYLADLEAEARSLGIDVAELRRPEKSSPVRGSFSPASRPKPVTAGYVPRTMHTRRPVGRTSSPFGGFQAKEYVSREPANKVHVHEGPAPFRQRERAPDFSDGINTVATEMANLDHGHYRDTVHGPGMKRAVTKAGWVGLAIGLEAAVSVFTRRIINGDIPGEFFPSSRRTYDPFDAYDELDPEDL